MSCIIRITISNILKKKQSFLCPYHTWQALVALFCKIQRYYKDGFLYSSCKTSKYIYILSFYLHYFVIKLLYRWSKNMYPFIIAILSYQMNPDFFSVWIVVGTHKLNLPASMDPAARYSAQDRTNFVEAYFATKQLCKLNEYFGCTLQKRSKPDPQ